MTWRVGSKVPINVYEGNRPVCQCHTVADARRIVRAMNTLTVTEAGRLGGLKGGKVRAARMSKQERSEAASRAGKARMRSLSPRKRREIARRAAEARWAKP